MIIRTPRPAKNSFSPGSNCSTQVPRVRKSHWAALRCRSQRSCDLSRGKTAVIVGAQWGDEGKGKIVDVLAENFSIVARYAGGHNAGHTVIIQGKKSVLQLIPCGVLPPGRRTRIGDGVVCA